MIFAGPRFTAAASGGLIAGGTVTFVDVPQVFSWAAGPPPPSYVHGIWQIGTSSRSMMGLQHQPDAGIISIQFGTGTLGTYPGGAGSRRPRLRTIGSVRIPGPGQYVHIPKIS